MQSTETLFLTLSALLLVLVTVVRAQASSTVAPPTTPASNVTEEVNVTRRLECRYQSCLELAHKLVRLYLSVKQHYPEFEYKIDGDRCILTNIPDGWQTYCEKRVYTMDGQPPTDIRIVDIRRGCGFATRPLYAQEECAKETFSMLGRKGEPVLNGTEETCRCFKDNCNGGDGACRISHLFLGFMALMLLSRTMGSV